jgi:excisionase family DNA binding protein
MTNKRNGSNENQPQNASDPFSQIIRAACEDAIKGVLKIGDISPRRLLSVEETATYLNLCEREVYSLISSKALIGVRHGRRQMIDIRDLESWIDARKAE